MVCDPGALRAGAEDGYAVLVKHALRLSLTLTRLPVVIHDDRCIRRWQGLLAPDKISSTLRDHNGGRIEVAVGYGREDGRVHYP